MVKQTIQIFCRVKPTRLKTGIYSVEEDENTTKSNLEFILPKDSTEGYINNKKESYNFFFQRVFDQQVKQDDVFEHVAQGVVDNVLSGYNGTIFAYGQTGSGKTFTITGGVEKYADRGIIPRALSYMFKKFEEDKDHLYTTEISYLEIYNENGYDLLDPRHEATKLEDLPKVALMEDPDQNIHLRNLSLLPAQNEEEALNHLFLGDTNRMIAETPMNQASTRSHCIFTIHVTSREPGSATIKRSKLHLVDLAGSERVSKSQVGGQLLTEAKYINLSLHFLEQVIVALSEKKRQHIPYRNSMMTSVLRDSLGGNCMTTMIATVAVDKKNLDESISTCRFAQRVAMIKNEATLNEELDPKLMIIRLKKEVQGLKDELALVTGDVRTDQLTQEELERLNELIGIYLADDDLEATLDVGGDTRKIQYCYNFLKKKIKERKEPDEVETVQHVPQDDGPTLSPTEVQRLREILQQRDNEISILVTMLKKERKRALNAENNVVESARKVQTLVESPPYRKETYSVPKPEPTTRKSRIKDVEMSAGRQEAFELYKRDYTESEGIVEQKELLKHRYEEAKKLGQEINDSRNELNHLKSTLERIRKQTAIQSTLDGDDSFEVNEREQATIHAMEDIKARYKVSFNRLKAMKAEIDHLHHLLDKSRVQMQHDFDQWWESQTRNGHATGQRRPNSHSRNRYNGNEPRLRGNQQAWGTPPISPHTKNGRGEVISPPPAGSLSPRESSLKTGKNALTDLRHGHGDRYAGETVAQRRQGSDANYRYSPGRPPSAPRSEQRKVMSGSSDNPSRPHNIPLTGDKETDADIMAFIKARETLMQRN
uniref:kinesin-like protein KIF6 n=1 Tax=Ciona intestinalis TaxID=7719 RepID=UPI000180C369|nr:kinesin-like protein KIF6 [Ciona intestinalis]|eukprot:XP_002124970.1 kinesin-like protein KIF6 [Ciona intestinalis]